ncbi:MAG: SNF2-related protein, partial [Proteobacteria bacterium]|nr:SNF2-related protein [Pseudomonadota bacterium]
MPAGVQAVFDAVRAACPASVWSRGVELARADAVSGDVAGDEEISLQVAPPGALATLAVTLYLEDEEWECQCTSRDDACEHVAAAVIAARRARKEGRSLASREAQPGWVAYRLTREGGGLAFEREIAREGEPAFRLVATLDAIARGRVEGPRFHATEGDIDVERALGTRRRGPMPREAMPRLLAALSRCRDVTLDGEPVEASGEALGLVAAVDDAPGGFRLSVEPETEIDETFSNNTVRCGRVLRCMGESGLSGREREELPGGRFIPFDGAAELVTETLPSLEARMPVRVRTKRLPRSERTPPRTVVQVERRGDSLSVLATLVYGDPPRARVDAGRLVPLQEGPVPVRDRDAEERLVRRLRDTLGLQIGHRVDFASADAIEFTGALTTADVVLQGTAHREFALVEGLAPQVSLAADRFDAAFEGRGLDGRATKLDAASVLSAWRRGESLVPLHDGGFAPLPADWLNRFGPALADLLAARTGDGSLPRSAIPDLARLCSELDAPPPPELAQLEPLLRDFRGIPAAALPPDLRAELRDYQREGVDWLCFLREAGLGGLLADDMGLGKTLQALCAVAGRTLVVAPTSVLHNWLAEVARFRPALRAHLYHGPRRQLDPDADLTLTSYALLRGDADTLAATSWDTVVLDEAQAIKNPESQVAQAAFRLRADWRVTLTGTPVENRLDELWSQLHFTNPGLLGGRAAFDEQTARPIAAGDEAAAARLRQRIRPFVLRRLKRDVAPELPARTEQVLRCELDPEERRVYDALRLATRDEVARQLTAGGNVLAALEALLRLRQAACHRGLVPGQEAEASTKLTLLREQLDEALSEGHKALV